MYGYNTDTSTDTSTSQQSALRRLLLTAEMAALLQFCEVPACQCWQTQLVDSCH